MKKYDIAILGAGESGTGAALLARKLGYRVLVSDAGNIKPNYKGILTGHEIDFEERKHSEGLILNAGEIIKSPGIPDQASIVTQCREKGLSVISEIEFACRHSRARHIFITGSNGKTTTTLLTHAILKAGGLDACLAGNVGNSFAGALAGKDHDYFVLEISSFQLDGMYAARADIGILTNITPDHLDRYENQFSKYIASKFRITQNQSPADHFIYCHDDPGTKENMPHREIQSQKHPFTWTEEAMDEGAYRRGNEFIININKNPFTMTLEELALQGRHNLYNSMAAGIAGRLLDIRKDTIKQVLGDFQNIEHRLEFIASIHGVEYINDSKATNVNSTWFALESMHKRVIWIAGGQDKGNDYTPLFPLVKDRVRAIICLGKDNRTLRSVFGDMVETIIDTDSAEEAVRAAYQIAQRGEVVLLSPACASFDLFDNYEDRGRKFKEAVKGL
jgi:UDP-N-acetylmuramoylalanine--D-glutamate ligase